MTPAALIFDLDDTLYPEREFVRSGFAATGDWLEGEHGIAGFTDVATRLFETGSRGRIFDEALRDLQVTHAAELVPELVQVYRAHAPRLALFPDAAWALAEFSARCALGLVTDGYAATQRNKVAALRIAPVFRAMVFTDDLGREHWKPSPAPFQRISAALACAPDACVYVGDNPTKDFLAPNRLGWRTVHLRRAGGEYDRVVAADLSGEHRAQHEIGSLRELEGLLS